MILMVRTLIIALLQTTTVIHRPMHTANDRRTRRLYPERPRETRTSNNGYQQISDGLFPSTRCFRPTTGRREHGSHGHRLLGRVGTTDGGDVT